MVYFSSNDPEWFGFFFLSGDACDLFDLRVYFGHRLPECPESLHFPGSVQHSKVSHQPAANDDLICHTGENYRVYEVKHSNTFTNWNIFFL